MLRPSLTAGIAFSLFPLSLSAEISPNLPGILISHSPASSARYIGSPSIVKLPDGSLLACHDEFGGGSTMNTAAVTRIFRSSDHGLTWSPVSVIQGAFWSSLFTRQPHTYLLGVDRQYGNIVIRRSSDSGTSWTQPTSASSGILTTNGNYHTAPVPIVEFQGRLWRSFERRDPASGWAPNFRAALISAPLDADLLNASSWSLTNLLPGNASWLTPAFGGWLEGNAVVTPDQKLVNLLRVDHPNHPEKIAKIEYSPSTSTVTFQPSTGFANMPGGAKKFTIRHDPASARYWTLANLVADADTSTRHPASTRNRLSLLSSSDLSHWDDHGTILDHPDPTRHGYQYIDWIFDDDDILAVSRTAFDDVSGGAANFHDANFLTFHRIRHFRTFNQSSLPGTWRHSFSASGDLLPQADADGDSYSNLHEYLAGSNPIRRLSTPGTMGTHTRVAIAGSSGLDLYHVSASHQWTFEKRLTPTSYQSILFHQGHLYGSGFNRIDKIHPDTGETTTLATRNSGSALTAGWTTADSQQITTGPDGLLYFSTAFGTSSGQGIFRLTTQGTNFQRFIARSGSNWDLNNARGIAFSQNRFQISSRASTTSTSRPIDEFDANGNWIRSLRSDLRAPQALFAERDQLHICGYSGTLTSVNPSNGELRTLVSGSPSMIAMSAAEIHGEICILTYQNGIWHHRNHASLTPLFTPQGTQHASMTVIPPVDGYSDWISQYFTEGEQDDLDDPDQDGVPNRLEFLLGTDPTDAATRFNASLSPSSPQHFTLTWPSAPGAVFTIRSSSDLTTWQDIVAVITGPPGATTASFDVPATTAPRFYRVEWNPSHP